MAKTERMREVLSEPPTPEGIQSRMDDGWRPVAMEWERSVPAVETAPSNRGRRAVPYGLRVSQDWHVLEEDPEEQDILRSILALIAGDNPLSKIAGELNHKGHRTRTGSQWTQVDVFQLLPRLIEAAPDILSESEWTESKKRILQTV